jgi:citrate lyase beta subunit
VSSTSDLGRLRSLLFVPGSDAHKLTRAPGSGADGVVADLEDAVTAPAKAQARELIARLLPGMSGVARLVRVNAADSEFFADDLALVRAVRPDAVVLPKAVPAAAAALAGVGLPIIAIVETAAGVRAAYEIARSPQVHALLLGAVDLAAELGLEESRDGLELQYFRSQLVTDSAAAARRAPFDAVYTRIDDPDGLAAHARNGRALGMGGKACIHPGQVPVINQVFRPSPELVDWAARAVAAAAAAGERGEGVVAVDGRMVDAPVLARARRILAQAGDRAGASPA